MSNLKPITQIIRLALDEWPTPALRTSDIKAFILREWPPLEKWYQKGVALGLGPSAMLSALINAQIKKYSGRYGLPVGGPSSQMNWYAPSFITLPLLNQIIAFREHGLAADTAVVKGLRAEARRMERLIEQTGRVDVTLADIRSIAS